MISLETGMESSDLEINTWRLIKQNNVTEKHHI